MAKRSLPSLIGSRLRESLFRNVGVPYSNVIALILGATASLLPLTSGTWEMSTTIWVFVSLLGTTMVLLVAVRPVVEKELDKFAWGLLVIINLGFGLGALIYQSRAWWIFLWSQYRRINTAPELLLEALFLLGVILGFFVVRNWAKAQAEFVSSLSAVLSGAFVATILGKLQETGPDAIGPMRSFAYYALGFTLSGAINLIVAARLTANYTNRRSITSRAILDFLYGSERATIIDGYFLKSFKEDPDYAKRGLTATLIKCRELVQREFAERMEARRESRQRKRHEDSEKSQAALNKIDNEIRDLVGSPPDHVKLAALQQKRTDERSRLEKLLEGKPSYFYQLIAIECDKPALPDAELVDETDRLYHVVYKQIGSPSLTHKVEKGMFRVAVSARWQDMLEYITAPGEYRVPFPYKNSVAGLALEFRQTIVMDRDRHKRFRNKQYTNGICPENIEQDRGLDEIDFLSYIAIPIVSRLGTPDENPVGVLTIDTRIFVSPTMLDGKPENGSKGTFSKDFKKSELTEYANNLYEHEDKDVKYIQDVTEIITPVLELYAKCRVGAI